MKDVFDVINNCRSLREYEQDEEIKKILDSGFKAPTDRGEEPWHFTVIQNKDLLNEIDELSKKSNGKLRK
ncbi:MAG: nitroreductase family protein [Methanobrevibacter sp.]|jgi:nitroreductase|nr:nitroreductase family protein [Methanobrevibacter sp.]